jgi:hypothetical protein
MITYELLSFEYPQASEKMEYCYFKDEFIEWLEKIDNYVLYWNITFNKFNNYFVHNCVIEFTENDLMLYKLSWG